MKKSPTDGFVDIHHHLIYGLDDGAQTWEQTQQMLTQARENGIRRIIATPHAEPGMRPFPMRELMERIRQARDWCIQQGMQLEILPGCEIFYTPQTVRMLRDGLIPTLAESEFVLVEFLPTAPYRELQSASASPSISAICCLHISIIRPAASESLCPARPGFAPLVSSASAIACTVQRGFGKLVAALSR